MIGGLIGALVAIGILCIVAHVITLIVPMQHPVPAIIWAVVGIICLLLLAQGLGVAIPWF